MALKNNDNRAMSSSNNQLHRSAVINNAKGLQALGNLSSINPESRPSTSPFSSSFFQQPMAVSNLSSSSLPPPLPPKRSPYMPAYNRYTPVSNYFSPFSRYPPGYSTGYPTAYPGYRMPPYGPLAGSEPFSSFTQMAEESTRPAFESIQSVVEVVSSISMMLESTYHAVHSSYSAILGVVDQFSRLKDHFTQVLSILAILRWLRWMCLKVLYILGVRKENPSVETAWHTAEKLANASSALNVPEKERASAWPFFMFLGLVVGAPWLMFKLLSKNLTQRKPYDPRDFVNSNGKKFFAIAAYDFNATQSGELSFKAGEKLMISPKSLRSNPQGGWYYAVNFKKETGLIPSTYLKTANSNTARNIPVNHRSQLPEENVNIPNDTVTVNTIDGSANSPENPVSVLVEKTADSPDLDVVVEKSPETSIRDPESKTNNIVNSE